MKKIGFTVLLGVCFFNISIGQVKDSAKIRAYAPIIALPHTTIKNQAKTGTCWSFLSISFLESEIIRMGHSPVNLSEMFFVHHNYLNKATNFIHMHGKANFGQGSLNHDVLNIWKAHGVVPEEIYSGNASDGNYDHSALYKTLRSNLELSLKLKNDGGITYWRGIQQGILNLFMGELPKSFEFEGASFTPQSYAKDLPISPRDYVELTSFTHLPMQEWVTLDIPDNWSNAKYLNLPIAELYQTVVKALEKGYSVAWDADVSELYWSRELNIAFVPTSKDLEAVKHPDSLLINGKFNEAKISQQIRQEQFEELNTTDDHLMHIIGMSKDQYGQTYFKVKNSWGKNHTGAGYYYVTPAYFKLKTVSVMLHRDVSPTY